MSKSKTILVATDLSEQSARALRVAAELASAHQYALLCVHVVEELDEGSGWLLLVETPDDIERQVVERRRELLASFCAKYLPSTFPASSVIQRVLVGSAIDEVLHMAHKEHPALIVVGSVGRGVVATAFLGSTANQLVRQSEHPVLLVPPDERSVTAFKMILAPVDQSEISQNSLKQAARLARASGGEVVALHAFPLSYTMGDPMMPVYIGAGSVDGLVQERQLWLNQLIEELGISDVVSTAVVVRQDAAQAIHAYATEHQADLICMGTHGRRGLRRFLLGNTAERVLRRAPCAVLVMGDETDDLELRGALTPAH